MTTTAPPSFPPLAIETLLIFYLENPTEFLLHYTATIANAVKEALGETDGKLEVTVKVHSKFEIKLDYPAGASLTDGGIPTADEIAEQLDTMLDRALLVRGAERWSLY